MLRSQIEVIVDREEWLQLGDCKSVTAKQAHVLSSEIDYAVTLLVASIKKTFGEALPFLGLAF